MRPVRVHLVGCRMDGRPIPPQSVPVAEPWEREELAPLNPVPLYEQACQRAVPGSALAALVGGAL